MANSGAVSLDTVMIKIESDAGKANSNISNLANTLRDLKSATAGGFNNIKKLGVALQDLRDGSKGLGTTINNLQKLDTVTNTLTKLSDIKAPSGLRQTIKRLNELSETSKTLYKTAYQLSSIDKIVQPLQTLTSIGTPTGLTAVVKNLKGLNELGSIDNIISEMSKIPQIVEPLSQLSNIMNPKGFKTAVDNLGKLPEVISKFDTTTFENLKRVSNELAQSLTPLADKMMQVANGYSAFSKIQNTFGKSATSVTRYAKQEKNIFNELASTVTGCSKSIAQFARGLTTAFGKKSINNLKSFHSKFKQVYLSLLGTRTLFTMIRKAASEYMNFDQTLQKFSTNVWKAFGAQLAPALEYAMYVFKQFVRVIYSVIYALTGIDLIARANAKAMQGWSKSAKDTLGNLQKFDDLNVVEFPKGNDDKELIEMDKIDLSPIQKVIDWMRKLKKEIQEALDTGEWYNVGKVFAEGMNEGLSFFLSKIPVIAAAFEKVATEFGNIINGVLDTADWRSLGASISSVFKLAINTFTKLFKKIKWKQIGKGLTQFIKGMDFSGIAESLVKNLGSLTKGVETALNNVRWDIVGKELGGATRTFLHEMNKIIPTIDFKQMGENLQTTITNIPWADIFNELGTLTMDLFSGLSEFTEGLTGLDVLTNLMKTIQETAINIDWSALSVSIDNLYKSIQPFAENVGEGLEWFYKNVLVPLVEYVINDLVPVFIDTLSSAIDTLNIIIEAAKPSITWMWDNFLNPLLKITKLVIVKLLEGLNKAFESFSKWANDNKETVTQITNTIVTFLSLLTLYLITKKLGTVFKVFGTLVAGAFTTINIPLVVTVATLAVLIESLKKVVENWNKLNGLEKVASVLGGLAAAAGAAAIAYGAFQSAVTAGIAAVAIVAGIAAIEASVNRATKRAKEQLNLTPGQSKPLFGYATGGFPEQGQYFYARENGIPEMVGTIGTQTAVANNTQIVDAVAQGVEQAMLNAMSRENFSPHITVNVGNKKLYEGQQAFNKTQQNKYGTINLY